MENVSCSSHRHPKCWWKGKLVVQNQQKLFRSFHLYQKCNKFLANILLSFKSVASPGIKDKTDIFQFFFQSKLTPNKYLEDARFQAAPVACLGFWLKILVGILLTTLLTLQSAIIMYEMLIVILTPNVHVAAVPGVGPNLLVARIEPRTSWSWSDSVRDIVPQSQWKQKNKHIGVALSFFQL